MTRRLAMFFVMLSIFWQALAVAGQLPVFASQEERAHAAMHIQEEGHYHHHDGAMELDDSSDSRLHLMADAMPLGALQTNGGSLPAPDWANIPPDATSVSLIPDPVLEGVRRPPKHKA